MCVCAPCAFAYRAVPVIAPCVCVLNPGFCASQDLGGIKVIGFQLAVLALSRFRRRGWATKTFLVREVIDNGFNSVDAERFLLLQERLFPIESLDGHLMGCC